jgi:multidrug resistance efflux pump
MDRKILVLENARKDVEIAEAKVAAAESNLIAAKAELAKAQFSFEVYSSAAEALKPQESSHAR